MQFASFINKNRSTIGFIRNEKIIDLTILDKNISNNMIDFIKQSDQLLLDKIKILVDKALDSEWLLLEEIELLMPVTNPSKIICVGLNYSDHLAETKYDLPTYPVLFVRFISSIVPHNQPIIKPNCSNKCDYEGELAVIIGKEARNIKEKDAKEVIFGYSIFNDVTLRDYQAKSSQWLSGKNFDRCGSFGPYITHKTLLEENPIFRIETFVNDQKLQDDTTDQMIFNIDKLIATITEVMTLSPGDIIVTGTPSGVGFSRNPPIYLQDNDRVVVKIDKLGTLYNIIKQQPI